MTDDKRESEETWIREVVRRHETRLVLYAARILGDGERARDVVQEVFHELSRADRNRVEPRLLPWLYTVARRRALDLCGREKRMREVIDGGLVKPAPGPRTPLEELARREDAAGILAAVGELPSDQQEVVRLKFQGGLSYREIGAVTGLPLGTIGWLIHVAIKSLRTRLAISNLEDTRS